MSARAIIAPGSFGDSTLEKININYIPEIPGAILHFSARGLPEGPLGTWYDLVNGTPWSAASPQASPLVTLDSQNNPVVYFDGVDDMITMNLVLNQPSTVILKGRILDIKNNSLLISGASGPSNAIGVNSASTGWTHFAGSTLPLLGVTPDALIHTFMAVSNGSNSVIRVDRQETVGNAGTNGRTMMRIGYGAGYERVNIYEVIVLPYAAGAAERERIYDELYDAYGF